ncbi:unnamed protein product [Symbiodinium sp. CCMP2592]|nr:unnamed protein product [Symbiodinium sp. CCMP2592]
MPYTDGGRNRKKARIAAVGDEENYPDDPEAQAVADFARAERQGPRGKHAVGPDARRAGGNQQKQAPEDESTLVTVLTLVDKDTGWPCSVQVPKKGAECGNFVLDTVEQYLNTLGHSRVTLQIDAEGSLEKRAVEGEHSYLAGLVRTWLMDLQNRYPNCMVDVNHTVNQVATTLGQRHLGAFPQSQANRTLMGTVHRASAAASSSAARAVFHYKWVDKVKEGTVKSRFTCADVKRAYTEEQEQDLRVFDSWQDRGAQQEKWVYVRPPPEWRPIWEEWVRAQPPAQQPELWESFDQMLFRLDGNLYGRRTAGSVYRDELEELLCVKVWGRTHGCVYRCLKTGIVIVHHIDDGRCAGDAAALDRLLDEDLCAHCEITTGPLEGEGVSVEVLGKTKTRLHGCILTAPDPKHAENIIKALGLKPGEKSPVPSRKPDLSDTTPLEAGDAARYRSAVGSGIYLLIYSVVLPIEQKRQR